MSSDWILVADAPLLARNSFKVAARADLLADLRDAQALPELLEQPFARDRHLLVLGEGSNLLITRDLPGLVLCLRTRGIAASDLGGGKVEVHVQAGENWNDLVRWSVARGLHGLENLALIPGTAGAAPIQNIGAYGAELADTLISVDAWDRERQRWSTLDRQECRFGYRDSLFKQEKQRWIITAITLRLSTTAPLRVHYAGLREELDAMQIGEPTLAAVAEAVSRVRTRKLPNPDLIGNAGSFFQNPIVDDSDYKRLLESHPDLPGHSADGGKTKLSAAWLIEQAGWRGFRDGDAGVSKQHALVLVNHANATGAEILALARRIAEDVRDRYGVRLKAEPRIL